MTDLECEETLPRPSEKGLFHARDGTRLYYEARGEGPPLIFCYGLTCRTRHWRHQIVHFSKSYRTVGFDYRGHHASGVPRNDRHLTLEWCARDLEDLLNYLGIEEAVCLGHSMGVPVLAHAAGLCRERIRGLVLVCGSVHNPFKHMLYTDRLEPVYRAWSFLSERFPETSARLWEQFTRRTPLSLFFASQFGFNPLTSDRGDILSYIDGVNRTPLHVFHALLSDYMAFDGRKLLPGIRQPALVVAGEDDCITPLVVAEEMVGLLPKGRLATIERGSHNAHTDFPDDVNARIAEFLEGIGYPGRETP